MIFENTEGNIQKTSYQMMILDNPANRTVQKISNLAYLLVLLSGSFYFAIKGSWTHSIVCAVLAVITFGVTWLIFLCFAPEIRKRLFQRVLGRDRLFFTASGVKT
jgi:hypothetical protein